MHKVKVNLSLVQLYIFLRAVVSENKFNHCFIACEGEQGRLAVNRRQILDKLSKLPQCTRSENLEISFPFKLSYNTQEIFSFCFKADLIGLSCKIDFCRISVKSVTEMFDFLQLATRDSKKLSSYRDVTISPELNQALPDTTRISTSDSSNHHGNIEDNID